MIYAELRFSSFASRENCLIQGTLDTTHALSSTICVVELLYTRDFPRGHNSKTPDTTAEAQIGA